MIIKKMKNSSQMVRQILATNNHNHTNYINFMGCLNKIK